jgi:hypothetical protein
MRRSFLPVSSPQTKNEFLEILYFMPTLRWENFNVVCKIRHVNDHKHAFKFITQCVVHRNEPLRCELTNVMQASPS